MTTQTEPSKSLSEHASWEEEVINAVARDLMITYSDATGIVEAQPFYMAQSWSKGLDAQDTAQKIIDESEK